MPKYNLELFKTLIINFTYFYSNVESKIYVYPPSEMPIYLTKQRKCATNLPISFVFNFWSHDMSHDHNQTLRHKKTSRFTSGEKFILLYVSW